MRESGDRRDTVKNCIKSHGPFRRQLDFIYIAVMPDALAALVSTGFFFEVVILRSTQRVEYLRNAFLSQLLKQQNNSGPGYRGGRFRVILTADIIKILNVQASGK